MATRVLVVDDDAVDRQAVRRLLAAAGVDAVVVEAATAEEAVRAAAGGAVDCILLDYYLPDGEGPATIERLREAGVEAPVVALTGQTGHQAAVAMMRAGAADYLAKGSLTADALERSLRHALRAAESERERRALLAREQAARREAQDANQAKDEFLATLSHELRTPLNSILGWTRLLAAGALDPAGAARALNTIQRNVLLQAQLIDDLLDISRIVTGKLTVERQPLELAATVAAVVESHRPAAVAAGIELRLSDDTGSASVLGDPTRLHQVVTNLVSNALKFTPAGGRVEVTLASAGTHAELTVRDSGVGIDPAFLPHVFERFRQADASRTRRQGGLGLGLAIVQRIVELHGGTVTAESAGRNHGACFRVRLPLAAAVPVVASTEEHLDYPRLDGLGVLVVDDDGDGRALLATLLERCGARVRTASSAREAIAGVTEEPPDLVLSDIAMPEQDGCEMLEEMLRLAPGTCAVAISACTSAEDRERSRAAGFGMHLAKPVDPSQLFAAVAAVRATSKAPPRAGSAV